MLMAAIGGRRRSARVGGDFVLLGVYSGQPGSQQQGNDPNVNSGHAASL